MTVHNGTLAHSVPTLSGSTHTSVDDSFKGMESVFALLAGHPLFQASSLLYTFSLPVIIIAGLVGNSLILILQRKLDKGERGSSSLSVLISSLSVSDSVMLVVSGGSWFLAYAFQIVSPDLHDVTCKLVFWLTYVAGLTSSWLLVAMTFQRATCIVWPHRAGAVWTLKAGRWTVAIIVVVAMLLNAHILYGRSLQLTPNGERLCLYTTEEYRQFNTDVWPLVDFILSSCLPFLFILVSNAVLVKRVRQSLKEAREKLMTSQSDQLQARQEKTSSMTLSLVSVSVAFIVLTLPLCLFFVLQRTGGYFTIQDVDEAARNVLLEAVGNVLWLTNNAVNFYIYLGTGSRYRAALQDLCCWGRA
ncbi:hypothetical protein ACOMHN_018308 [Nucella lapillus]